MSLDVYLTSLRPVIRESSGIFVRENGQTKEISRAEWNERNPGHEPCIVSETKETNEAYSSNITHNLGKMAEAAGMYYHLWRPEEIGITKAAQLIDPLKCGIACLEATPEVFENLNPDNGWGSYEELVKFCKDYLTACEQNPDADISVSR